jgi:predicted metal-dependent hydrolase
MYKPEKFEIKHKYIDGQLIMYKLIYRNTKNSYMHINESDQTVEIIVSKYATPNMTEQFVDTYLKQMHENIMKLSNSKVVDKNYNYMCIFGKKYQIKVLISHNKKNYEIIGNTIYFKVKKTSDCNELVKLVYEDLTYGFIKKRFLF